METLACWSIRSVEGPSGVTLERQAQCWTGGSTNNLQRAWPLPGVPGSGGMTPHTVGEAEQSGSIHWKRGAGGREIITGMK